MKEKGTESRVGLAPPLAPAPGLCWDKPQPTAHRFVPVLSRDEWLRTYTDRILRAWLGRGAPLGLAPAYAQSIRKDLFAYYHQPLMRAFIEQTYEH